jgi:hypothetical protein
MTICTPCPNITAGAEVSDQSALRLLQTAIENVRENCTGPEYKSLMSAIDSADSAVEKALGQPDDSAEDKAQENQPRDLKAASARTREAFATRRQADRAKTN